MPQHATPEEETAMLRRYLHALKDPVVADVVRDWRARHPQPSRRAPAHVEDEVNMLREVVAVLVAQRKAQERVAKTPVVDAIVALANTLYEETMRHCVQSITLHPAAVARIYSHLPQAWGPIGEELLLHAVGGDVVIKTGDNL